MGIIRIITAGFGGYLFASIASVTLSLVLPFSNKIEAISFSSMMSFLIWLCFIIYSFGNIKLKNLLIQFVLTCISLYLINLYLAGIRGL